MFYIKNRNVALASKLVSNGSHITYAGVVAGHNPGEVWVDHLENPSSALVWSNGLECFQFMGRENNESFNQNLAPFIKETIISFLNGKGINFFEFAADNIEWYPVIYQALANEKLDESWQYVYKATNKGSIESPKVYPLEYPVAMPQNFEAIPINQELISPLGKRGIENQDFLINYLKRYWETVENYLSSGYGYVALSQNKIVSIAVSTAQYESANEIGVETLKKYRNRGLSSSLVKMLLKTYYEKGIDPFWDCSDDNLASQKTIEKSGLVRAHQYKVNWFYF